MPEVGRLDDAAGVVAFMADVTYVWTLEGWLYLAVVLDCISRRVVGWALRGDGRPLAHRAGRRRAGHGGLDAPAPGGPHPPLSIHGCQYTSLVFGHQLRESGLVASMGSVGDALDNAVAESFFATLTCELAHITRPGAGDVGAHRAEPWPTRDAARGAIFAFIEAWYSPHRRHSTLRYLSPAAYEEAHHRQTVA